MTGGAHMSWRDGARVLAVACALYLTLANLRHLQDDTLSWINRYASVTWGLMAIVNILTLFETIRSRRADAQRRGGRDAAE